MPRPQNPGSRSLAAGTNADWLVPPYLPDGRLALPPRSPSQLPQVPPGADSEPATTTGDPVTVGGGQLVDATVDLEIPGALGGDGLHFRLERSYSSAGVFQGVLGRNWAHSYEEHLVPVTEFFPGAELLPRYCTVALPTVRCVAHRFGAGQVEIFVQDPTSLAFLPPPGRFAVVRNVVHEQTQTLTWMMREPDGLLTAFDTDGRLISKRDRHGATLNFWYGEDGQGRLQAVIDPLQRVIRFEYDGFGRLVRVIDFAGRAVEYRFEAAGARVLPPELEVPFDLINDHLPGMLSHQFVLIEATRVAPATPAAPSRRESWSYGYLDLSFIELPPPPSTEPSVPGSGQTVCDSHVSALQQRTSYELMVDHLIGNLQHVHDPQGRMVLDAEYDHDFTSIHFDRVVSERYGDGADEMFAPWATFEYGAAPPADVTAGLGAGAGLAGRLLLQPGACAALARAHVGRPLLPAENKPGMFKVSAVLTHYRPVVVGGVIVGVRPPPGLPDPLGDDPALLQTHVDTVCAWTRTFDRRGVESWFGTNFMGHALVTARRALPEQGGGLHRSLARFDIHGRQIATESPGGRRVERKTDALSPSPFARGHVLEETEIPTSGAARTRRYVYEPLYGQLLRRVDELGRLTEMQYDYQELDVATGTKLVELALHTWGGGTLADVPPELVFSGMDLNGDGHRDRVAGDRIGTYLPPATLADGSRQLLYSYAHHNEFGQVTWMFLPGNRSVSFGYHPAVTPTGGPPPPMSASYLGQLSPEQRVARQSTGGLLATSARTLAQEASAQAVGKWPHLGEGEQLSYDAAGELSSVRTFAGDETRYEHDGFGLLVRVTDAEGYQVATRYDARRRPQWLAEGLEPGAVTIDVGGVSARRTRLEYSVEGHLTGRCTELAPGACAGTYYLDDARANPDALVTTHHFDHEGNLVQTIDGEGFEDSTSYDARGLPLATTRGGGLEEVRYRWDADGNLTAITNAAGEQETRSYDGHGRVSEALLVTGARVLYQWDEADRLRERRVVDAAGANLALERSDWDERDRLRTRRESWILPPGIPTPAGWTPELVTTFIPDEYGRATRVTDTAGGVWRFTWSSDGALTSRTDPAGRERFQYRDPYERSLDARDTGEGVDVREHVQLDHIDRPVDRHVWGPDGTQASEHWRHDGLGAPLEHTDAQGNTWRSEYDLAGRLLRGRAPATEGGVAKLVTATVYDRRGLPRSITDADGVVTSFAYSSAGRPLRRDGNGMHVELSYDVAGRPSWVTSGSGDQSYLWYAQGSLAGVWNMRAGAPTSGRYLNSDALGRLTSATSYQIEAGAWRSVSTRRSHDGRGRLVLEGTRIDGGSERVVSYDRDARGAAARLIYPDGSVVSRKFDADGRELARSWSDGPKATLAWRGDSLALLGVRNAAGPLWSAGTSFDGLERPTALEVSSGRGHGSLLREQRGLDAPGRVREQTRTGAAGQAPVTRAFEYAGAGWLTAIWSAPSDLGVHGWRSTAEVAAGAPSAIGGAARQFVRDRVGSLVMESDASYNYFDARTAPGSHALTVVLTPWASGGITYEDGRVTQDLRARYTWDADGRLRSAAGIWDTTSQRYLYDALGRRVERIESAGTVEQKREQYVWDGWDLLAVYEGNVPVKRVLHGPLPDQILAVDDHGAWRYPYQDLHGDLAGVLDQSGAVVEQYAWDPYGQLVVRDAAGNVVCDERVGNVPCQPTTGFGMGGQWRDPGTGLYYQKHRYYSVALRSFLSTDPLGFRDSMNPWAFTAGDPVNLVDSLGLSAHTVGFAPDGGLPTSSPTDAPGGLLQDLEQQTRDGQFPRGPGLDTPWWSKWINPLAYPVWLLEQCVQGAKDMYEPLRPGAHFLWDTAMTAMELFDQACAGDVRCGQSLGMLTKGGGYVLGKVGAFFRGPGDELLESGDEILGAGDEVLEQGSRVFHVTPQGVVLPPGGKYDIPSGYIENVHRAGSYGVMQMSKGKPRFKELLRIDPPTPKGQKGPDYSHYHLSGDGEHLSPRPADNDPGFPK